MKVENSPLHPSSISAASSSTSGRGYGSVDSVNTSTSGQSTNTSVNTCSDRIEAAAAETPHFPPPKTDKPRPHICTTCTRSFARLEHLKRHERSHTKEKPFECPECTRCFARRDLLLRHQQKLHLTGASSGRTKGVRRESTNGVSTTSAKTRKSSAVSSASGLLGKTGPSNVRPRANTFSHVESSGGLAGDPRMAADNAGLGSNLSHHIHMLNGQLGSNPRMNFSVHGRSRTLSEVPRIATNNRGAFGLRTVPSELAMDGLFDFDELMPSGSTVNPAQLNLDDSVDALESPFREDFTWVRGTESLPNYTVVDESALDGGSPSAISTEGPAVLDILANNNQPNGGVVWSPGLSYQPGISPFIGTSNATDYGAEMDIITQATLGRTNFENHYPTPPPMSSLSPNMQMNGPALAFQSQHIPLNTDQFHATSVHSSSMAGSYAAASITEVTRQALIFSLSQPFSFGTGTRKVSTLNTTSPLSPLDAAQSNNSTTILPFTEDLQRYVNAYIHYFHPHFPFLHIPTLSFDSPAYMNHIRPVNSASDYGKNSLVGGGGCLILSMAAIGALYEYDRVHSKDLFEAAKKLIQLNLEERRKADLAAANNTISNPGHIAQHTPLWLVQAMLLNVIYGHNCGDKVSGDIASTHCTALVSLARAADLVKALPEVHANSMQLSAQHDTNMHEGMNLDDIWNLGAGGDDDQTQWYRWVAAEERKRTLFALFHMSSVLVSAYNHAPAITNSEIQLDLPCEEDLWSADCAASWTAKGGAQSAKQRAIPFAAALSVLLTASQTQNDHQSLAYGQPFGSGLPVTETAQSTLGPSTFGCLVLINALHNYIWETRQRHSGHPWTTQETEAMYAHIEPALRAWQAAWASNPSHSIQRPNPFGAGPLSADSIPLLDLAYVRLFVNFGPSKEAFWRRDFDGMSKELARGSDIMIHAELSESQSSNNSVPVSRKQSDADGFMADVKDGGSTEDSPTVPPPSFIQQQSQASKRERHLRKAAFYAADSLSMSEKLGVTFADFTSRELPVQSALCTFDCAQVLAEWVSTVQERVGRYLGIIGKTPIDFAQVPAIFLLEDEDCKLLEKVQDILMKAEAKITYDIGNMEPQVAMATMNSLPSCNDTGYGSQMLMVTAYMLEKAAVWPVTSLMAHGLRIQAMHMSQRAANSTMMTLN